MHATTFKCEVTPLKDLDYIQASENSLVAISTDNKIHLMKLGEEVRSLHLKNNTVLLRISTLGNLIVVLGWNEETRESVYFLYNTDLKYRDELVVKSGSRGRAMKVKYYRGYPHVITLDEDKKISIFGIVNDRFKILLPSYEGNFSDCYGFSLYDNNLLLYGKYGFLRSFELSSSADEDDNISQAASSSKLRQ